MGGDTPVYNEKNIIEVPLGLSVIAYLLNANYEKSAECNTSFLQDNFISTLPKY